MKSSSLIVLFLITAKICQSQVLIALLLGDKLNSGKMEFGINLGNSFSTQTGFTDTKWRTRGFDFGLWLNVRLDKDGSWWAHLGAIPKTKLGLRELPVYHTSDASINAVIDSFDFEVERKVSYIHVPLNIRYKVLSIGEEGKKHHFFIEGGPQISLRTKAVDIFRDELDHDNIITVENDLTDEIRRFDVSIVAGLVWKFRKLMELSVSYNQGFLDIDESDATGTNRNQFVMVNVNLPVGAKKAAAKAAEGTTGEQPAPAEKEAKPKKEKKSKEKAP